MRKTTLMTVLVLVIALAFMPITSIAAESAADYHYVSDVERWYYEKQAYYYYPHGAYLYYSDPYYPYYTYPFYAEPYYTYPYDPYYSIPYYSTVATAISYRNVKVYEYYLKVSSAVSGVSLTGSDWYKEGSGAEISASPAIDAGADVRYVFSGWSGDYAGTSPSATVTMDKPKTITANYKAQYRLTIRSTPSDALGLVEEGWYDEGTARITTTAPEKVDIGPGQRYIFDSWYLDGTKVAGNPISTAIDKPHMIEAKYTIQYYLNVESPYGNPSGSGWYDQDSTATFEVTSPVEAGFGREWAFEQWRGDALTATPQSTITVDGPKTVTAIWKLDSAVLNMVYTTIILAAVAVVVGLVIVISRHPLSRGLAASRLCKSCGYRLDPVFKFCPVCGVEKGQVRERTSKS